jgi:hypothetical protein
VQLVERQMMKSLNVSFKSTINQTRAFFFATNFDSFSNATQNSVRRRLDMAEDELTFLKAVFEEYKDSSGELEAELDAQLKDLERSNLALKRENEQVSF